MPRNHLDRQFAAASLTTIVPLIDNRTPRPLRHFLTVYKSPQRDFRTEGMLPRKFRQEQSASIGHIRLSSLSMTGVPRIFFPPASASIPPRTFAAWPPKQTPTVTAEGGSGYAYTINAHPAHTASHVGVCDDAARLMKWGECHCLCRCCNSQRKGSNGDQSDHSFPPRWSLTKSLLRVESPIFAVEYGWMRRTSELS